MENKNVNSPENITSVSIDDALTQTDAFDTMESDAELFNSELEILKSENAELNDRYLRLAAELENSRRRAQLDAESIARNRSMSIAQNFLPLMDAIDAAMAHSPNDTGVIAMARAMESAIAQSGITRIESIGQQLNPQFHNAIQVIDALQSDAPCAIKSIPNTVIGEMQAGYMFGDTVLRTAMVIVSK